MIQLAAEFGIKDIGYFHTTDAWGSGANKVVQSATKINGINIIKKYAFERDTKQAILDAYINDAKIMGIVDLNKKYELNEIVKGDSIFCATGITSSEVLKGIKIEGVSFTSETLVTHKSSDLKKIIKNTTTIKK